MLSVIYTFPTFDLEPKNLIFFVHRPAKVSWSVTLGLTTPKSVHKPARVCRFVTSI